MTFPVTVRRTIFPALFASIALAACSAPAQNEAGNSETMNEAVDVAGTQYTHISFTRDAFESAQAEGKPILVDVFAPWCPTCKQQQTGIAAAANDLDNADLVVFRLDYDTQADDNRDLRIMRQSTLIAFKGSKETGRAVAVTSPMEIAKLVATTR